MVPLVVFVRFVVVVVVLFVALFVLTFVAFVVALLFVVVFSLVLFVVFVLLSLIERFVVFVELVIFVILSAIAMLVNKNSPVNKRTIAIIVIGNPARFIAHLVFLLKKKRLTVNKGFLPIRRKNPILSLVFQHYFCTVMTDSIRSVRISRMHVS